ncbi:hypothetical protein DFA_02955 [Cavenderia fasciculata]|uniref:IPT/TIG domain-containing protein n=1 Tax=Cavenderia fasciculata TaxID=261658 RepID=F4PG77_CACFS|nr:uncharacterized protein DFA_02955 [Cavenderia fasciculata]EGG24711.1 hypothetical protein DFA_02955 [Cavenderia fasciculata]|eukprot:XP_004362562.1 hypothetical protein DFA_02955 [Cavenderia fasciculata]
MTTSTIKKSNEHQSPSRFGSSEGDNTYKSYLVTLDSKQEWDFIGTNLSTTAWVSGRDFEGNGNYTYSSGPQSNQPLFNMFTGQCWGIGPTWNFIHKTNLLYASVICEIEPIEEVYIPSIGTNGGSITINNLSQFNTQTINITFSNPTKQLEKSCNITSKQETSVTCIVPPLSGFHNVTVQDASGVNSTHYAWQPYPPFIKAVYPSFTANGLITLIGDNFGDNTNNIVFVNVSTSNITCNITFATSTQIICQLESSLAEGTKLLPISISVDDVYTRTYKPHIYVTMGATPNAPYIGAIESAEMYQCFSQSLNIIGYESYRFWQGVSYNSNNNSFTRNNGPFKGTISPLNYTSITSKMKEGKNILYNINDGTISSKIEDVRYYTPLITFYTGDTPIIDNITSTNIQNTTQSLVTINGNHFGKDQSYVLISIEGQQCKSPQFIGTDFKQFTCLLLDIVEPLSEYNVTIRVAEMVTSKMVVSKAVVGPESQYDDEYPDKSFATWKIIVIVCLSFLIILVAIILLVVFVFKNRRGSRRAPKRKQSVVVLKTVPIYYGGKVNNIDGH